MDWHPLTLQQCMDSNLITLLLFIFSLIALPVCMHTSTILYKFSRLYHNGMSKLWSSVLLMYISVSTAAFAPLILATVVPEFAVVLRLSTMAIFTIVNIWFMRVSHYILKEKFIEKPINHIELMSDYKLHQMSVQIVEEMTKRAGKD